jgi:hypothetical protein
VDGDGRLSRVPRPSSSTINPEGLSVAGGSMELVTPEERFADLVDELAGEPGVQPPTGSGSRLFGAETLRVGGSIFAMLAHGALVVKLPAPRVAELIAGGAGGPFTAGKDSPMREWLTVGPDADWEALAREALAFVGARNP